MRRNIWRTRSGCTSRRRPSRCIGAPPHEVFWNLDDAVRVGKCNRSVTFAEQRERGSEHSPQFANLAFEHADSAVALAECRVAFRPHFLARLGERVTYRPG